MPMVPLLGADYFYTSRDVSAQRSRNFLVEKLDNSQAKSDVTLIGRPGIRYQGSAPSGACRGLYTASNETVYAVYGDTLYSTEYVLGVLRFTAIEVLGGDLSAPVSMTDNGKYLVIADGSYIYAHEFGTTFANTVSIPFSNPSQLVYANSRIVAINETNFYYWSELGLDGALNWPALNVSSAEGNADPINAIVKKQGEIYLFGPRSYEIHQNNADPDEPFVRVGGSFSNIGCQAKNSPVEIGETVFWLGSSVAGRNTVYMSQGYNAVPISDHAIEDRLEAFSNEGNATSDAVGYALQVSGHVLYFLNLVQADVTFVYDATTGVWTEWNTRDAQTNVTRRFAPVYAVFGYDQILLGNSEGPSIFKLDTEYYQDDLDDLTTVPIQRQRWSQVFWDELKNVIHDQLQIDLNSGSGITTGQGSDPQAVLEYSDDGGYTWSNFIFSPIGKQGQYKYRCLWTRLGMSRERVYRITITDPIKVVLSGANLNVTKTAGRR